MLLYSSPGTRAPRAQCSSMPSHPDNATAKAMLQTHNWGLDRSQLQILHCHGCGVGVPGWGWPGDAADHGPPPRDHHCAGKSRQGPGPLRPGCPDRGQVAAREGMEGCLGTLSLPAYFGPCSERPLWPDFWTKGLYLCVRARNRHGATSWALGPVSTPGWLKGSKSPASD